MRIDGQRGRLEAGLVREPPPAAPVCDGPEPAFDRDRVRAAAIAWSRAHHRALGDADIGDPTPFLLAVGTTVRRVAEVPVGRGLGELQGARDPDVRRAALEALVLVDPDSGEVLDVRAPRYQGPVDPYYTPLQDGALELRASIGRSSSRW